MKVKKTARIVCSNGNTFWSTQKQFWGWVREGHVVVTGDFPLTGRFRGRREQDMAETIRSVFRSIRRCL